MSFFNDCLQSDAVYSFIDPDGIGAEAIVYRPKGGTPRTINAVVTRNPPQDSSAGIVQPLLEISVANHATLGISSADVDYGGDSVTLSDRIGGPTRSYKLHRPSTGQTDHDAGMLTVELR